MKDSLYIVMTSRGIDRTCKTQNFTLHPGERAFRLDVEVPSEVFSPARIPTVRLSIPSEALITEMHVEAGAEGATAMEGDDRE